MEKDKLLIDKWKKFYKTKFKEQQWKK
jgi:hypothetical protein